MTDGAKNKRNKPKIEEQIRKDGDTSREKTPPAMEQARLARDLLRCFFLVCFLLFLLVVAIIRIQNATSDAPFPLTKVFWWLAVGVVLFAVSSGVVRYLFRSGFAEWNAYEWNRRREEEEKREQEDAQREAAEERKEQARKAYQQKERETLQSQQQAEWAQQQKDEADRKKTVDESKRRKEAFDKKCKATKADWHDRANSMLETLLRPAQETEPDEETKRVAQDVSRWLVERFMIPEGLKYPRPLRDKHILFEQRHTWAGDEFPQLLITAYMFGATMEILPAPHQYRVHFYKMLALEQMNAIYASILTWCDESDKAKTVYNDGELRSIRANAEARLKENRSLLNMEAPLYRNELKLHQKWELQAQRNGKGQDAELKAAIDELRRECAERALSDVDTQMQIDYLTEEFERQRRGQ